MAGVTLVEAFHELLYNGWKMEGSMCQHQPRCPEWPVQPPQ